MSFPRYEAYQATGLEWLGSVPAHWELRRLGHYFVERREKVSDTDYPPLSVTKQGVVPQLDTAAKTDDNDNRKLVLPGDFVINSRSDRNGSSGLAGLAGSVSLINTVLQPRSEVYGPFVHHLLRSGGFQQEFYRFGKGIVADLWSTNYSDMRAITLAMPPVDEQREIAAFLDRETKKLDALIAEQQRLIELLAEKRKSIISYALMKGLDPDAPVKASGVEWLGDVPRHWRVARVKHVVESIGQGWSPQCEASPVEGEHEWGVLKVGCVNGGVFNPAENKRLPKDLTPMPELALRANDILISRANTRELVGSAAVVPNDHDRLLLCDKLYRLRLAEDECVPQWLACYLGTSAARGQIELAATGASASMVNIAQSTVLDLPIPLPPAAEQRSMLRELDRQLSGLHELTAQANQAVQLLHERRSAIISAAVTGQVDVRGLADAYASDAAAEAVAA